MGGWLLRLRRAEILRSAGARGRQPGRSTTSSTGPSLSASTYPPSVADTPIFDPPWPSDVDPANVPFRTRTVTILRRTGYFDDATPRHSSITGTGADHRQGCGCRRSVRLSGEGGRWSTRMGEWWRRGSSSGRWGPDRAYSIRDPHGHRRWVVRARGGPRCVPGSGQRTSPR